MTRKERSPSRVIQIEKDAMGRYAWRHYHNGAVTATSRGYPRRCECLTRAKVFLKAIERDIPIVDTTAEDAVARESRMAKYKGEEPRPPRK